MTAFDEIQRAAELTFSLDEHLDMIEERVYAAIQSRLNDGIADLSTRLIVSENLIVAKANVRRALKALSRAAQVVANLESDIQQAAE